MTSGDLFFRLQEARELEAKARGLFHALNRIASERSRGDTALHASLMAAFGVMRLAADVRESLATEYQMAQQLERSGGKRNA